MTTKIEWCDETWNPIIGCSHISDGCKNCYAAKFATRLAANPKTPQYHPRNGEEIARGGKWTGKTRFLPERLEEPLKWKKPRRVFTCSMADLFHNSVRGEWIHKIYKTIALAKEHTFIVLTKRPGEARKYYNCVSASPWPLPNLWLGVSVESPKYLWRVDGLLGIPAAVRFVSYEPALVPVDFSLHLNFSLHLRGARIETHWSKQIDVTGSKIHWVIAGAEQGPGKRRADLDWFRLIRDQCKAAGTPFFFKKDNDGNHTLDGVVHEEWPR